MKLILMSVVCMGLVLPGVRSDDDDINCYDGIGDVGSSGVEEKTGFKSCVVTAGEAGGQRVVTRKGLREKMDGPCVKEICYCQTNLCNIDKLLNEDIKCYVGDGDVGSSEVKETGGFKSCSISSVEEGGQRNVSRAGLSEKTDKPCYKLDISGVEGVKCLCQTNLCNTNSVLPDIKCYEGIGDVGSSGVKEKDGFKSCAVSAGVAGSKRVVARAGLLVKMDGPCVNEICYCQTNLCNTDKLLIGNIKCYVGTGDVGSPGVVEKGGFKSCAVSAGEVGGKRVVTRTGLRVKMDGPCVKEICYCQTNLCNTDSMITGIECYVGTGDVGSSAVVEMGGFKSCSISAVEAHGKRVVARTGLKTKKDDPCFRGDLGGVGKGGEICYCQTNLCNSAPATGAALMTMTAMALLAKLLV